jgi:hypothetical protein
MRLLRAELLLPKAWNQAPDKASVTLTTAWLMSINKDTMYVM